MKILCVGGYYKPAYVYGGPARSTPALLEAMAKRDAQVTVFTTNANGPGKTLNVPTDFFQLVDGIEVMYFPVNWTLSKLSPFCSIELGRACRKHISEFDIVYIPGSWTYPVFAAANEAIRQNIPYVISPRGSFMNWAMGHKGFKKRLYLALVERRIINHAAAIHMTSSLERQQWNQWGFTPSVTTIANGLDMAAYRDLPRRGKLRESLNIPASGTITLFVGRLHQEKRLELIITSFAIVASQLPDTHLVIVGAEQDGSGERARNQTVQLGLSERVHFLGQKIGNELLQAYSDADMLVLLSYRENFGMVVVEAMAAGLPVLLSSDVGIAQEIDEAGAGKMVIPEPNKVATVWNKILTDSNLRNAMRTKGTALVSECFEIEIVANKMLELFCTVTGKGK